MGGTAKHAGIPGDKIHLSHSALGPLAYSMFFVFGSVTSLNDVLMPKLKELFALNYAEMTLVQFCFFTSYALISIPASYLVDSLGYLRSVTIGLLAMAIGCLLFIPAAAVSAFSAFLGALFVVAAGVTVVQVAANPLVIDLGNAAAAPRRLTLAHACNSVGTVVAPYVGAIMILGAKSGQIRNRVPTSVISHAYALIALLLVAASGVVWSLRNKFKQNRVPRQSSFAAFELLRRPRVLFGVIAMFLYVGAEVAIGSLLVNYLVSTLRIGPESAGKHLAFYWGGLLVGRVCGLFALRIISASMLVIATGVAAVSLVILSIVSAGELAGWTLLAVGLCNSVMFPLIFDLASCGLGERTSEGSGLICVAIVGGAFVPLLTGRLADLTSLSTALVLPAICYLGITIFGCFAHRRDLASTSLKRGSHEAAIK